MSSVSSHKTFKEEFSLDTLGCKSDEEQQWMESIETSIQDALEDRRYEKATGATIP